MAWTVRMPKLGQTMESGLIQEWLKEEQDEVEEGEPLAVIETDKFTQDLEARESGVLRRIVVPEGEEVPTGEVIAVVAGAEESFPDLEQKIDGSAVDDQSGAVDETDSGTPDPTPARPADRGRTKASPAARKLASNHDVDLRQVEGTGVEGAVITDDVERVLAKKAGQVPAGPAKVTPLESRSLSSMRRTIADRLGRSYREAIHVTLNKSIDMTGVIHHRETAKSNDDRDPGVIDYVLAGLVPSLKEHPELNGFYREEEHVLVEEINIGTAVDVEDGLLTPVLPDLEGKGLTAIAGLRRQLTRRALNGDCTPAELENGTFTVSNLGGFGIESFNPVINPPQVAILGVGELRQVATPGEDPSVPFEFRPFITFSLSFDHRVVDGADAARFLSTFAERLTRPERLDKQT